VKIIALKIILELDDLSAQGYEGDFTYSRYTDHCL